MGESFTVPDACALVVRVRVAVPAVAVIVTEVASVACQLRVTLCPGLIELALADKVTVGLLVLLVMPLHAQSHKRATGIVPQVIQRQKFVLI